MSTSGTDTGAQRIAELTKRAEAGDAEAQFQLGCAYADGQDVEHNPQLAALWFKRSAKQDHPEAIHRWGQCLYFGDGTSEDRERAFAQYLRGANLGNLDCIHQTGLAYTNGQGVDTDHELAVYWLKRGADAGHAACQDALGTSYYYGDGVEKSIATALDWYKKAAENGYLDAYKNIGLTYNADNEEHDALEAMYWFKRGAELGNLGCMRELGCLLSYSDEVKANPKEAIKWLRYAAVAGDSESYSTLSMCLVWESADPEEVIYWASRSLHESGENPSAFMADAYERLGNWPIAAYWWNVAKEKGADYANGHLETCAANGATPVDGEFIVRNCGRSEDDILRGEWIMGFRRGEEVLHTDNLPVPPAVQEEMERQAAEAGSSIDISTADTDNLQQHPPEKAPQNMAREPERTVVSQQANEQFLQNARASWTQLPPGSILAEKYLIEKVLGRGGMAIVFKAKHLLMDRAVAIKMMLPELANDEKTVARFQREAKNASVLRHPNVITIYDFGITPDHQPFMVMDYLEGKSLEDVLEVERWIGLQRAIPILTQMCDALNVAHEAGIIHRDIKPSNIMLETVRGKEHVKLVDFGIAKDLGSQSEQQQKLTKTGEVFGSLIYMSPEQCMGKPLGPGSDIYSLGCVLFECLTGQSAFMGETVFDTMSKHIYDPAPSLAALLPNVPQANTLEHIFQRAVAKTPEQRYQSTMELKDDLLTIL